MNTPAHGIVNLALLDRKSRAGTQVPVLVGAFAPDLPIMAFYAYERFFRSMPGAVIWSRLYYDSNWQWLFDLAHSIPLALAGFCLAFSLRARSVGAFFLSLTLHAVGDLALHNEDAHRHFLPLSDWRFRSPISYWDPRHFGWLGATIEVGLVIGGSWVLLRRHASGPGRAVTIALLWIYALGWVVAILAWG